MANSDWYFGRSDITSTKYSPAHLSSARRKANKAETENSALSFAVGGSFSTDATADSKMITKTSWLCFS